MKQKDLKGFKYFKRINALLEPLHKVACERDRAGNRELFMDQYMVLLLLHMFNPICVSIRSLQQASTLKKVQQVLGVPRASLGSFSEAARVFDSSMLVEIVEQLSLQLKPMLHDPRLDDIGAIITAVDGTLLPALSKMAWALWKDEHRAVKTHVQFEVLKGVPISAVVTDGNADERDVLAHSLQAGLLYVLDRGYAKYSLMQKIIDSDSSFVCRIRDDAAFELVQERELSRDALNASLVRDAVVRLGSEPNAQGLSEDVRIIEIECTPHIKAHKNGRGGPQQGQTMLLATDRKDLPPEVIALIYKHRWAVETFFRTFKHLLGCRHLLSTCENGIELQTYAAILACLLIALYTGRKPTLRTYEMMCWYFMGWADLDELKQHIARLQKQG